MGMGGSGRIRAALAAIGAAVLLIACATAPRSPEQVKADQRIEERVYTALDADPVFYFKDVDVDVYNGVVTLSGYVWSTDAIFAAQRRVARVPGVVRVLDQMKLEREGTRGGGDSSF